MKRTRGVLNSACYTLRPDCKIIRDADGLFRVFVNNNQEIIETDGKNANLLEKILPVLDGTHSLGGILKKFGRSDSVKKSIKKLIMTLFRWGLIAEVNPCDDLSRLSQLRYFSSFSSYPMRLQEKLSRIQVGIVGGEHIIHSIVYSLSLAGIGNFRLLGLNTVKYYKDKTSFDPSPNSYEIKRDKRVLSKNASNNLFSGIKATYDSRPIEKVCSDLDALNRIDVVLVLSPLLDKDYLTKINDLCLKTDTKLLSGILKSSRAYIGPFVIPFQSSCVSCMISRLGESSQNSNNVVSPQYFSSHYLSELFEDGDFEANLIPFILSYAHLLSGYLCLHILGLSRVLINHQIVLDYKDGFIQQNFILKSPRCPSCGKQNHTK